MLSTFLSADSKMVITTYPDITLSVGDSIRFNDSLYVIVGKCFNVDANVIEYMCRKSDE